MTAASSIELPSYGRVDGSPMLERMSVKKYFSLLLIIPLCLSMSAYSEKNHSVYLGQQNSMQSLMIENTHLTAKKYFDSLMKGSMDDRRYAEMYLTGVLDASEGVSWCDYKRYKTITIDETLFVAFQKLPDARQSERASSVIVSILKDNFPCEGHK